MAWSEHQRRMFSLYVQETRQYARTNEISFNQARQEPELRFWRNVLRQNERRLKAGKEVDTGPHGAYAESLVRLGYRRNTAWWNVGETEKVRKRTRRAVSFRQRAQRTH